MWLGEQKGQLSDWLTQRWVQATGRRVAASEHPWLGSLVGPTTRIGGHFYQDLADSKNLQIGEHAGLMPRFADLSGPDFDASAVDHRIVDFYENTSKYRLDTWSHWCGAFRPFGWLLAVLFSRRLEQLNIPLSSLDGSKGLESIVIRLTDAESGMVRHVGWIREIRSTKRIADVGDYSVTEVPGHSGPCVRVVFPLPNGNATVILRPEARADGSLVLHSSGRSFGDPGFYFFVQGRDRSWSRYVAAMRESLHVYIDAGELHTDHVFRIFGVRYLHLHYRCLRNAEQHVRGAA